MTSITKRSLLLTASIMTIVVAVLAMVFGVILHDTGVWAGYTSANCDMYCENSHLCDHEMPDRPAVQQPANAWTNLAYLLVGLLVVTKRVDLATVTFFLANLYLCLGSFLFHASMTKTWQTADVAGMSAVEITILGHAIHALSGCPWHFIAPVVLILGILSTIFKVKMAKIGLGSTNMMILSAAIIVAAVVILVIAKIRRICTTTSNAEAGTTAGNNLGRSPVTEVDNRNNREDSDNNDEVDDDEGSNALDEGGSGDLRSCGCKQQQHNEILRVVFPALLPGVLLGLGVLCRTLDINRTWCNPESVLQGHAFWHCFTAAANYSVWEFLDCNQLHDILSTTGPEPIAAQNVEARVDDNSDLKALHCYLVTRSDSSEAGALQLDV